LISGLRADTEYKITVKALSATRKKNAKTIFEKTKKHLIEAIYSLPLAEYGFFRFDHCIKTAENGFLLDAYVFKYGKYLQAIMKTDQYLNIIWTYYTEPESRSQIMECKSGGFLIISGNEIFKLNKTGQRLWRQTTDEKEESWYGGCESSNGDIILIGATTKKRTEDGVPYVASFITKLSNSGSIVWTKYGGEKLVNHLYKILQNEVSNFFIMGETSGNVSFLEIDHDGNVIWEKFYQNGRNYLSPKNMQETPDGHYFISATQTLYQFGRFGFAPCFMKVAKDGTVIWDKVHPNLHGGGLSPSASASEVQPDNSSIVLTVDDRGVGLAKLSSDGDVIDHRAFYGYPSGIYVSAISENQCVFFTHNGYFIIVNWDGHYNQL